MTFRGSIVCAALGLYFLVAAGSANANAPEELLRFPAGAEPGETNGLLRTPMSIAANSDTGHLYIGETGNHRISEFTSEGEFVRAWGWGVVASGPDNEPQNEIQKLTLAASSGTFALVFSNPYSDGGSTVQQTGPIAFDASAATVQAALEALESPGPGDVAVTSPNPGGGPWTIEFTGKYTDTDIAPLKITDSTLVGTASVETVQGGANFEVCEAAAGDVCRAGQESGFEPGQLHGVLAGLAVDTAGNVYAFEEDGNEYARLQKFSPTGSFQLMLGGDVNKTTNSNVCTVAEVEGGAECGRGVAGTGPGQFDTTTLFEPHRIAIGPDDTVYVGDNDRIQEFEVDGTLKGQLPATGFVENIAIDPTGNLYVDYLAKANVFKYDSAGFPATPASFSLTDPGSLALDPAGNLYVGQDPPGFGSPSVEPRVVEFDPLGAKLIPTPAEEAQNKYFAQIHPSGLTTLRCAAGKGLGALYVTEFGGHVTAYGSNPGCEVSPPKIVERYVLSAGTESARIATKINPNGVAATYYLEYGTEPCQTSSCAQVPAAPGKSLEDEGSSPVLREVELGGLNPGTNYYYRVVAIGSSITVKSPEGTFATRMAGTGPLPDGRGYEMVSPAAKNSADVAPQGGISNFLMQAAESGPKLVYPSSTPFADAEAAPPSSAYLGVRDTPGREWSTTNVSPQGAALEQQVKALSADLSTAAIIGKEPPLCCGAANGIKNLYLRDLATGAYTLVTSEEPQLAIPKSDYCVGIQGFTPDFSRVFFKANGALTDDAPLGSGWSLYEWSAAEGIQLVSILPGGAPATPTGSTSFGQPFACEAERVLDNAISADGNHAVWTSGSALYDRINGVETVQLDQPQGGPGAGGSGIFWGGSSDGSKVFFTASSLLTAPNAHANDLYRYDFSQPPGSRLVNLTAGTNAAGVKGVVGNSTTGDTAYFVATGVLAANDGAAIDPNTGHPEKAKSGANNLYLWREGGEIRFIGRFASNLTTGEPTSDAGAWDGAPSARATATTADGDILAFTSVEPLTGYESIVTATGETTRQVYFYDAGADELTCVSCNPTGQRPVGPEEPWVNSSEQPGLIAWKTAFSQPRFLSTAGNRLLFESFDALVEEDTNQTRDVYEFERPGTGDCTTASPTYWASTDGCIDLLSDGVSPHPSFLLDASADGKEAFISTAAQLVGIDTDEKYDAYDVRVGGEPQVEQPTPPVCDEGEVLCKPPPPPPPAITSPASNPPLGQGNLPTKTCPKGKILRKGRCVRKPCPKGKVRRKGRCVKKHRSTHNNHHRGRRQGGRGR